MPTTSLAQVDGYSQNVWLTGVTSSVDEGERISFTVNREGRTDFALDVTVNISPNSPIEGFNILTGGDDSAGADVTVTIAENSSRATRSIATIDNTIVNEDVAVTLEIQLTDGVLRPASRNKPYTAASTVNNGNDAYVTGVRLPPPLGSSQTINEGETIEIQFMRCVSVPSAQSIQTCTDATSSSPRPGATSPAMTSRIYVETEGTFFSAENLFDTTQEEVLGMIETVDAVAFAGGQFRKTFTLTSVDDDYDEADGSLIVSVYENNSSGSNERIGIAINDDDLPKIQIVADNAWVTEGGSASFTVTRSDSDMLPKDRIEIAVGYHAKVTDSTTTETRLVTIHYLDFSAGQATRVLSALDTHNDTLNDGDGMVRADMRWSVVPDYNIVHQAAWVRIVDDDVPGVLLALDKTSIVEGQEPVTWTVTRTCCSENRLALAFESEVGRYYPDHLWPDYVNASRNRVPSSTGMPILPNKLVTTYQTNGQGVTFTEGESSVGSQGGYEKRRLLPFPADAFEGIPRYVDYTFSPRNLSNQPEPPLLSRQFCDLIMILRVLFVSLLLNTLTSFSQFLYPLQRSPETHFSGMYNKPGK